MTRVGLLRFILVIVIIMSGYVNIISKYGIESAIYTLELETASAVAWSPDGEMLAVRDTSGIGFYTPELELVYLFKQPSEHIKILDWSSDGEYIATVGFEEDANTIYVWDVESQELLTIFDEHSEYVSSISWDNDSETIATGSWDQRVLIWNPTNGDILDEIDMSVVLEDYPYPNWIVFSTDWSNNGEELAIVVLSVGIYIWNTQTEEITTRIIDDDPYPPSYYVSEWSFDDASLATNYNILEPQLGNEVLAFQNCPNSLVIEWHPTQLILAIYTNEMVVICDALNDEVLLTLEGASSTEETTQFYLDGLSWHPDGELLAGATGDGFVRIWQIDIEENE